ncbi:MAG TPA: amino acid adenylation domain-containing protein, partial [Pyrinomonadaceae bacterium]|nr:amino acid adenylation domain-containing protein [Pyrinomonadaceae bacterium]
MATSYDQLHHNPVVPDDDEVIVFPVSFAQQRLWFLEQLTPGGFAYNIPLAVRVTGKLNIPVLERALSEIINRHETLRTSFSVDHSQAVQLISPARPLPLPLTDLSQLTTTEREQAVERLAKEEAERSFDLTKAPLLRARLLRLTSEEHVLLFTMHHIVSDGWSMGVLFKEIATLYSSFLRGEASPLEELAIQYADYAVWQREHLSGDLLEEQMDYWRKQLAGVPAVLPLPIDRARPTVQSYRGSAVKVSLDAETASAMRELSRREGVTLFMLLLAAFDVLLWRWTAETDVVVGTPIANRTRAELEGLIGFFVNTLPLRVSLAGNPSFRELVNKVREVCLGAYSHQELPFEKLVEEIAPERNLSHTPLFQVMLSLQNVPIEEVNLPGLKLSMLETENSTTKFDLQLALGETETGVHGSLHFNTDLFERATVERLAGHLATLLESAIANPDQRIAELPLLTPAERHQLLDEWNDASQEHPSQCLHELFERQVERAPDDTALVLAKEKLSYRELNCRANQLAHYLRAMSVGPESLVAVVMERSLEMIVSVLGVLKAGAAYLPVDPAYPKDRISFMLEDAAVSVLITTDALRGMIGEQEEVRIVCLDTEWTTIASHPAHNPQVDGNTDNLAYVIYTSGSTGKPKGVMVSHGNVVRLFTATEKWFRFSPDDVWTLFHSYAFDFSVWEMWGAFLYGGRLVVVPYLVSRSPDSFYELLCREQVTVLNQTPTAFRQLMRAEQEIEGTKSLALRLVIFGGEALEPGSLRPWFDRHGDQFPQLVNMYGITETTVHVTYRPLLAADANANGRSVVGIRISDLELYVLDEHLELTPVGVTGEVYVGGGGLARGYLHQAELTAERFIPNPFSREAGSRLYRTGDLARLHPDGDLEYLGRSDQQVKIRGFRIELGEIETVLQSHPGIQQVTVAASDSATGEQRLVAYVIASNQHSPSTNDLERYLRQRLPEYMIPAAFVLLESLPLTASGKVDRRALPAPDARRPAGQESYRAPRTPTEQALASAWAEVLGLERVGINDNFFSLGGDSIRTIQVRSKAQERGIDFSLQQLFQYQTIAELSDQVSNSAVVSPLNLKTKTFSLVSEADLKQLPADLEDAYPVARLQMGMLFHAAYDSQVTIYHNVNSFELRSPFDPEKLETCLRQLAARHPILRTSFELGRFSEPLQLVHETVRIPLQIEDLRELSAGDQNEIISEWFAVERSRPFNIREAPLLRFHIHRRSDDTFQFSFTEHHAILDGWSVASMLTELFRSYSALLHGREHEIESPLSTFRDFVASERFALASVEQQRYWEQKLKSSTMTTMPRSPARVPHFVQQAASRPGDEIVRGRTRHNLVLSPEVSERLQRLSQDEGIPLKSILLAAHVRVLSLCSGRTDVVTGLVSNGRLDERDGDRVLGLFLNNLPFRLEFRGGTWLELVRQAFEVEREALAFRHYPISELPHDRRHRPLFETVFNFVHFHIYESITGSADFELLGARTFGETEAPFVADFGMNSGSRQVELRLSGNGNEFSAAQLQTIGQYYLNALTAIAHDPHDSSDSQKLMSASESHKILVKWNDTRTDYPPPRTAHELFEAQVTLTPDSTALVLGQEQLSYRELNERANQLAHHLRALGARPELLIGIMMDRSVETVVSVLAVLKAGAAYVPFDPSYPRERLSFMLEDAGVSVLLTQDRLRDLMASSRIKIVCPDSERAVIEEQSRDNPHIAVSGENLAYVIYTSGSTGQPKGVMITHRSLCNLAHAQIAAFHLAAHERVLQFASPSFDASVSELFKTFLAGGTLCLAHKDGLFPGPELLEVLQEQRITTVTLPPSALRALPVIELPDLRRLILAGEACRAKEVQAWQQSGRRLFNAYGPTEATVCATVYECEGAAESPPIGRPIANVEVYVLDEQLQPVPVGTTGELYIGGMGVARGYWHRPEQTAENFIPHPYSHDAGARLYRTGDLARYLPHGNIEYLGRDDEQVKIRGFRIELAEVEIALREHPSVRECAVLAPQDETGEKRLAAYIAQAGPQTTLGALRRYLQERLPEHMIPSSFVMLDEMPLTVAGKIDRRALTEADGLRPELDEEYVAPGTDLECSLATMWQTTLGVERVGIHDNFFEIGGDSIRGAVLVNRLQEALGEYVYIVALFDAPTIAELADYLNRHYADAVRRMCPSGSAKSIETGQISQGPEGESGETVLAARKMKPIAPAPRDQRLQLSFAQQRLWFLDQLAPDSAAYNLPLVVRLTGALDIDALRQTLTEILRRHETLRTSFAITGSQPLQVVSAPHPFDLPLVDLSHLERPEREQTLRQLSAAEATQPFDLTVSPLLRARLLRLGPDEHVLLFTMHHIITDGWSMGVLTREVAALYTAFAAGEVSPLPELPIQYADYAAWQREQLQGVLLEEQLGYWRAQLSGAPPVLKLPTDKPRPHVQSYHGGGIRIEIGKETAEALRTLSRNEGMTLFMVLLAAFDVLLWRRSGQEEIVVGSPVAGRTRSELEGLIGFFVNTLALRVRVEGNLTFRDLLGRVKEAALGAYAHQDVPFEKVVEELATERNLSHTPLFQVMLVVQNAPHETLELPGLKLSSVEINNETAKFDLTLSIWETERGIDGRVEYNRDLFDQSTIERMVEHLHVLLGGILRNPDQAITQLSLLSADEQYQLVSEWNQTQREYPSRCLHELFEEQVERAPEAVAVV